VKERQDLRSSSERMALQIMQVFVCHHICFAWDHRTTADWSAQEQSVDAMLEFADRLFVARVNQVAERSDNSMCNSIVELRHYRL